MPEEANHSQNDFVETALPKEALQNDPAMIVAQAIMDVMPIMIAVFDQSLRYIYCNKQYVKMTNPDNPNWRNARIADYLPATAYERIKGKLDSVLKGERISFHINLTPAGAPPSVVLVNYYPIVSDGGKTVCLMTGQDVTELKAAEDRLFRAQKLETLGQLTGGIAHDFNNHVGVIVGNLSLLKLGASGEKVLRRLEACRDAADRCAKLTSQLLSFASRQPLNPRARPVSEHLKPLEELLSVSVASNVEILVSDHAAGALISVDTTQFGSAIMNLVLNARDAMQDGGTITVETRILRYSEVSGSAAGKEFARSQRDAEPARIEARETGHGKTPVVVRHSFEPFASSREEPAPLRPDTELVRIEVKDTGHGMAPDVLRHAFEPFFTTKQEGSGSGMGLAMVYGFVRQSGGFVDLDSTVGVGTSIRMYLPRVGAADVGKPSSVVDAVSPEFTHTVLVVEDDKDVAHTTCEMLKAMGHVTHVSDNAPDALDILERRPQIDVVITDVMLRGQKTGLALRASILQRFPHIRVICVSGYQDQKSRRAYAVHSDIEFLPKPFDYLDLVRLLHGRSHPN